MAKISLHGADLSFMRDNPLPDHMRSKPKQCQRSASSHYVISDTMDLMVHPSNGQYYDSKSRFRAETRARGLTEVGNETIPDRVDRSMPEGLRHEIERAYDQHS